MEGLINRYRNITVLLLLVLGQLFLLAYQIRTQGEARLIRSWTVGAVTPMARGLEGARGSVKQFFDEWVKLRGVYWENQWLKKELDQARLEKQALETQLREATDAAAMAAFLKQIPSKALAARIIGTGTGLNARALFVDRGTQDGVEKGMAVIVPEGIAGKVIASFPQASLVMLATEPGFVASLLSQKNRVRATMRGKGGGAVTIDSLSNLQKVEEGEWFYTSGDDRIFPRGLRVGRAKLEREGNVTRQIKLEVEALKKTLESLLIVTGGVHALIPPPDLPPATEVSVMPGPDGSTSLAVESGSGPTVEADKIRQRYQDIGTSQSHQYGTSVGRAPNFSADPPPRPLPGAAPAAEGAKPDGVKPPAAKPEAAKPEAVKPEAVKQ